ncbi:hypothetical protein GOBAR_AA14444 [Gossypium barbadense]|uniref:Uncharacterized protein n=1 Tax=Gossypium barbadense TaxID=3634 RepID=A0A2P5XSD9_GOSBA|nr:hypothetical protein GOBAR_AA14444 [Gossypium barbadense]
MLGRGAELCVREKEKEGVMGRRAEQGWKKGKRRKEGNKERRVGCWSPAARRKMVAGVKKMNSERVDE